MTVSDMTATKRRILDAAQEEFAAYGLAGARIDRIAKEANASKERLYAYFGDKVTLFHAVLDANFLELLERHRGSAHDLPGEDMAGFAVTPSKTMRAAAQNNWRAEEKLSAKP